MALMSSSASDACLCIRVGRVGLDIDDTVVLYPLAERVAEAAYGVIFEQSNRAPFTETEHAKYEALNGHGRRRWNKLIARRLPDFLTTRDPTGRYSGIASPPRSPVIMSERKLKLWSRLVEGETSDTMEWGTRKDTFETLDDMPVEDFHVKRRKKRWQDQSPSKKSGTRRVLKTRTEGKNSDGQKDRRQKSNGDSGGRLNVIDDVPPTYSQHFDEQMDICGPATPETRSESAVSEEVVEQYLREFQEGRVGFYHIGTFLYIVQDWSTEESVPMPDWSHFRAQKVGMDVDLDCRCPEGRRGASCVHKECYLEFREERFRRLEDYTRADEDDLVVLFRRERLSDLSVESPVWLNLFSVREKNSHESELEKRAVVTFRGTDDGCGEWLCTASKHMKLRGCQHQSMARNAFRAFNAQVDEPDINGEGDDGLDVPDDEPTPIVGEMLVVEPVNGDSTLERSISYLPIRPPEWVSLPTDIPHYPRRSPKSPVPNVIELREVGRSNCDVRVLPEMLEMTKTSRRCKVYTLTEELERQIELVRCPRCHPRKHCFIGPDTRGLGLFNYNNSVLMSHELLDEYVSRFTSSVSPFAAFVEGMSRIYSGRGFSFIKEDLFRSVWFAYASLQDFSGDMSCPVCREEPDCVIWDGITLAYGKEHLTGDLKPPTELRTEAPVRNRHYSEKPQMIQETRKEPIRRLMRRWLEGSKPVRQRGEGDSDSDGAPRADMSVFGTVCERLGKVSMSLKDLFGRVFSLQSVIDEGLKRLYRALFIQLAAEESAVQMVNWDGLRHLYGFVQQPARETATRLVGIPALWKVLEEEWKRNGRYPSDTVGVCLWMYERAREVFSVLFRHQQGDLPMMEASGVGDDWRKVRLSGVFERRVEMLTVFEWPVIDRLLLQPTANPPPS
ncbi:hypothetical protein AAF712_013758 [Marasmius tenuissimus]|uniref:HMG domain-containing protein n=1 Tax=Marasmius tenuissimus TaxID=585030 RepID=A0ABR2ZFD9_9AGAR